MINDRIAILLRNGLIGLTIVVLSLWVFLDFRLSFWVAMGIPISLSGALVVVWAAGSAINSITLFALIMVLGIILTTISTLGGLSPLIIETDLAAQPLKPMALSIASGVAFATMLTVVLIPCLLAILNDIRCVAHFLLRGTMPTREEVEPARTRNIGLFEEGD